MLKHNQNFRSLTFQAYRGRFQCFVSLLNLLFGKILKCTRLGIAPSSTGVQGESFKGNKFTYIVFMLYQSYNCWKNRPLDFMGEGPRSFRFIHLYQGPNHNGYKRQEHGAGRRGVQLAWLQRSASCVHPGRTCARPHAC